MKKPITDRKKKKPADSAPAPAPVDCPVYIKKPLGQELLALASNAPYMIALILTILFGYGFSIANNSISTDDFTLDIYYPWDGEMIAQGRFTMVIVANLLKMMRNVPYFCDILSVTLFGLAVMLMCVFFSRAAKGRLSIGSQIIFSCVTVSYPLMNEIFVYGGGNVNVCLGYLMTAAALLLFQLWYEDGKKLPLAALFVTLFFVVSLYESFAVVFLCGVIMSFILNFYYNPQDAARGSFSKVLLKGLVAIGILGLACLIEFGIGQAVLHIMDIEASENAATDIRWVDGEHSFAETVVLLVTNFVLYFYVTEPHYLPIRILLIFLIICLILMFATWIKNKNFTIGALFFSLFFMQFFLTLLSGRLAPARTCQYYAVFVGFLAMLIFERLNGFFHNCRKIKKESWRRVLSVALAACSFVLIFEQSYDLNAWLCLDVQRSEEEIAVARTIGDELCRNYDTKNKPVLFIGKYEFSKTITDQCTLSTDDPRVVRAADFFYRIGLYQVYANLKSLYESGSYKFVRSNLNSYLYWATSGFKQPNQEMMKLYRYLGYNFHSVDTFEQYQRYVPLNLMMPAYPEEGYITEEEGVIIVNLGYLVDQNEQDQQMGLLAGADS